MKENEKLIDVIIDLGVAVKELRGEVKGMRIDLEKYQAQTNRALGEMRLGYLKLDESFNKYALRNDERANNHEARLVRLEEKDGRGAANMVSEPRAIYKKTKKKK